MWSILKKQASTEKPNTANVRMSQPRLGEIAKAQKNDTEAPGHPVEVLPLEHTTYQVYIPSRGESVPGEETEILAETEGKIHTISPNFEIGSFVKEGEILVQLDQEDLRADVAIAEARVAQAEATLAQEKAQAEQALLNWTDIGYEDEPGDLVLRKPQLKQAEATLKSAQAQVEKEKRELERSIIRSPYHGIVAERIVSLGQKLSRGNIIGRILATSHAEISLPISVSHEVFMPDNIQNIPVSFSNPLISDDSLTWEGFITNREPQVDENTKQLHLRARIQDPYRIKNEGKPLPVGQPVIAQIKGKEIEQVYVVPKKALRGANEIHIATPEKRLKVLTIDPIWTAEDNIIFKADLPEGTHWIKTVLRRGINEMKLEFIEDKAKQETVSKPTS